MSVMFRSNSAASMFADAKALKQGVGWRTDIQGGQQHWLLLLLSSAPERPAAALLLL